MSFLKSYFHNLYYSNYTLWCLEKIYGPLSPYMKDKSLSEFIDFYTKYIVLFKFRLDFRIFHKCWIRNAYSVSAFIALVPLNLALRLIYLIVYWLHIFYWFYRLVHYVYFKGSVDLQPHDNDPIFGIWYLVFIYRFTWKRAHLHSYNNMYNLLKKLTTGQPKQGVLQLVIKLPFIVSWYIFRILTSVPRQVILDSYSWSERFVYWSDITGWQCRLANGVTSVSIVQELGPLTFKRIYCTETTLWNFNPTKLETSYF